ncbi:UNVERIFIED_CONTAM: hypothetical protein HDU68_008031 [Siphonaria sp. JEL0065]|nr:hypothetical protein HDU68_008031 [Siphonaria sp. JEL0065]
MSNTGVLDRSDSGFHDPPLLYFHKISRGRSHLDRAIYRLPSELIFQMLSQLPLATLCECARVNHAFNEVATSLIWHTPRFKTLASFQTFANLCKDTTNHQHAASQVKLLDLTRPVHLREFVDPMHIAFILEPAPRLVHCKQITDASIAQLLVSCSATLQSLDVSYCRRLTDAAGLLIAGFCGEYARLRVLKLRGCGLIRDATLVELGNQITASLEALDVSSCPRVTDRGIFRFLDKAIGKEVERRGEVRKKVYGLGVGSRWCGSMSQKESVVDRTYEVEMDREDVGLAILNKLKKQGEADHGYDRALGRLKEFRFSGNQTSSRKLTWTDLERILGCLFQGNAISTVEFSIPPPPKEVDFGFNTTMTDLALFPMTEITEEMVLPVPRLKSLILAGCTNLTVEGILPLIQMYTSRPDTSGMLEYLDITGTGVDWKAWRQIVSQCEGLNESMKWQTGFERYLPEHVGVDENSFDKEYVFGNRQGVKEDVDVWVPVHRRVNAGSDVDSDSEDTEDTEATEVTVYTLKDAKTAEIMHASTLVSIAKYYGIK